MYKSLRGASVIFSLQHSILAVFKNQCTFLSTETNVSMITELKSGKTQSSSLDMYISEHPNGKTTLSSRHSSRDVFQIPGGSFSTNHTQICVLQLEEKKLDYTRLRLHMFEALELNEQSLECDYVSFKSVFQSPSYQPPHFLTPK